MKLKKLEDMQGKTIKTVEPIPAEFGRTYRTYLCLTFTDDSKIMLAGHGEADTYNPCPDVEGMQKAPNYFSAEDIANKVLAIENQKRADKKRDLDIKKRHYEELQKELKAAAVFN